MYAASTCCNLTCHQFGGPPDNPTVLMLQLKTSHGHCMRILTAVLVLHSSCSSVGCRIQHLGMHKVLHVTACCHFLRPPPVHFVLLPAVAYTAAASAAAIAVGFIHLEHSMRQTTAYTPWRIKSAAGRCPRTTSLMVCHISTCAGTKFVCSNTQVLQQFSSRLLLAPSAA
jgi:hypothetical protein